MDVTDALVGEHGVLHLLVEQLEEALERIDDVTALRAAAEPLAISVLGHHRAEEETVLAPYERHTGSIGPLKCLRHEHQLIDQQVRALVRMESLTQLREQLRALLGILRRHFAREEQLLFGVVREAMPADELRHQGEHWAEFRGIRLPA